MPHSVVASGLFAVIQTLLPALVAGVLLVVAGAHSNRAQAQPNTVTLGDVFEEDLAELDKGADKKRCIDLC